MGKKHPRYDPTGDQGVNHVKGLFGNKPFEWIPRDISTDMGIDLEVEIVEEGNPTGRLIGVQVKTRKKKWKGTTIKSLPFALSKSTMITGWDIHYLLS